MWNWNWSSNGKIPKIVETKIPKSAKTTFSNRAYTQVVKHDHYLLNLTTNQCL